MSKYLKRWSKSFEELIVNPVFIIGLLALNVMYLFIGIMWLALVTILVLGVHLAINWNEIWKLSERSTDDNIGEG